MRRSGRLIEAIAGRENLRLAFAKALRGKRAKGDARAFSARLEEHLGVLAEEMLAGSYEPGAYRRFTILDPKEREICAPPFRDRVVHHAILNVCEPVFERVAIADSYACRVGKGRDRAVDRARQFARRFPFFLKMDVRKYFDSVDHGILLRGLGSLFSDGALLALFGRIVGGYETAPGRGLPIGSLTSQHFANHYLGELDRFVKESLRRRGYVRYMDDFVVWGENAADLKGVLADVGRFLAERLRLELKPGSFINRTALGMDFLGYRIWPGRVGLNRRSKARFARKLRAYERRHLAGDMPERELQARAQALLAFTLPADAFYFRRRVAWRSRLAA